MLEVLVWSATFFMLYARYKTQSDFTATYYADNDGICAAQILLGVIDFNNKRDWLVHVGAGLAGGLWVYSRQKTRSKTWCLGQVEIF